MLDARPAPAGRTLERGWSFTCLACRGGLVQQQHALRCQDCDAAYPVEDGIPILLPPDTGEQKKLQAEFFGSAVDEDFERERPLGTPPLYEWLLREKFRRSVEGLDLHRLSALVVCGGSGMDAEFLAAAGARVLSTDLSLGAVQRARERARRHGFQLDVAVADAEGLPFADQSIDVVYVHDGLHHLERPLDGLDEMARVARIAICVTEPARAALTGIAVRMGLALDREEAGNHVARETLDKLRAAVAARSFRVVAAERYGMYYRHEPGRVVRLLSHQPLLGLSQASFRLANLLAGRVGNKLALQAIREPARA